MNEVADIHLVRQALNKSGDERSYDDILVLKNCLSKMQFYASLFAQLLPNQTNDICRWVSIVNIERQSYVFQQGDFGNQFFVILHGICEVRVDLKNEQGVLEEQTVHTLAPNNHFGERALEHDEPRSAGIFCPERVELISMSRKIYKKVMKARAENEAQTSLQEGTKAYTLRVLGKRREDRSDSELQNVAYYLEKRVAYFKKFTPKQQIELSRVCELISIFGRNILFKQGQIGQAFYILMSGTCDVIVSTPTTDAADSEGMVVNTLGAGAAFGERALESDEGRTATIVTGDDLTELLVISKSDYHVLIADMIRREREDKVALLKDTHCFGNLDEEGLDIMAKYMEPKNFLVDSEIFKSGTKATDLVIVASGEVCLTLTVLDKDGENHYVDLGRLGKGSVLGDYLVHAVSFLDENNYRETCITNTYVTAFVIAKYDLFFRVAPEVFERIKRAVRYAEPPKTGLFQNTVQQIGYKEFKMNRAWHKFRLEYVGRRKKISILEKMREIDKLNLDDDIGNMKQPPLSPREIMARHMKELEIQESRPSSRGTDVGGRRTPTKSTKTSTTSIKKGGIQKKIKDFKQYEVGFTNMHKMKKTVQPIYNPTPPAKGKMHDPFAPVQSAGFVMGNGCFKYPFSIMHIHREKANKMSDANASRRIVKCFIRLCGTTSTAKAAKAVAESQLAHSFIHIFKGSIEKEDELSLNWKVFTDFESLPVQYTDFYFVYCRSAIIEYAYFSPTVNFLEHEFPLACRQEAQNFACVSVKSLKRPPFQDPNDTAFFLKEIGCISHVQGSFAAEIDCAKFARTDAKVAPEGGRIVALPMYDWHLISDDVFSRFDSEFCSAINPDTNMQILAESFGKNYDGANSLLVTGLLGSQKRSTLLRDSSTLLLDDGQFTLPPVSNPNPPNSNVNTTTTISSIIIDDDDHVLQKQRKADDDSIVKEIEMAQGLERSHFDNARIELHRTLKEFKLAPVHSTGLQPKGPLGTPVGIISKKTRLENVDNVAQLKFLDTEVFQLAETNRLERHSHGKHGTYSSHGFHGNTSSSAAAGSDKISSAVLMQRRIEESKLEMIRENNTLKDRLSALTDTVNARTKVLSMHDELLSIESYTAQKRNERWAGASAKLSSLSVSISEEEPSLSSSEIKRINSKTSSDDGGGSLSTESSPEQKKQTTVSSKRYSSVDMSIIPKQLASAIRNGGEAAMERVESAIAEKRVKLFTDLVELPSHKQLIDKKMAKRAVSEAREREAKRIEEYNARHSHNSAGKKIQHHHHHHHSYHHSNATPPPSARNNRKSIVGLDTTANVDSSTVSSPSSPNTIGSIGSVSTNGDGPRDTDGAKMFLSYSAPDALLMSTHQQKHKYHLNTKLDTLNHLISISSKTMTGGGKNTIITPTTSTASATMGL